VTIYIAAGVVLAVALIGIHSVIFGGIPPKEYAQRPCTGARWRRRFPSADKAEIREFLSLFLDAFSFRERFRLHFDPDDRIMDVYRALYPSRLLPMGDGGEIEQLVGDFQERYGLDMEECFSAELSLGKLFARATGHH